MERLRIVAWWWEYLEKTEKFRAESYVIVYLDATWIDSLDIARMIWSNNTARYSLLAPPSKGKRVVICFAAGSSEGFTPNPLLLRGKQLSESYVDYHDDMNAEVF